jgi:hypothetical protein
MIFSHSFFSKRQQETCQINLLEAKIYMGKKEKKNKNKLKEQKRGQRGNSGNSE